MLSIILIEIFDLHILFYLFFFFIILNGALLKSVIICIGKKPFQI